jgi:putative ABC transport system ATP-binding protein
MGDEFIHALDDVTLHVKEHEFVAVCGPSGSGKTTLMNIMGCLDTPDSGTYLLDGIDVSRCSDKKLSNIRSIEIGFIFQQFNLLENMTALENVELPLIYQHIGTRERRERAIESLDRVGLLNRKQHHPAQLSGGQQQRVAIARALASHSKVILADEPTGNLDTHSGDDVMRLISELSDKGSTIVLITHNERIARLAQRTVYVKDGKLYNTAAEAGL